MSAESWAGRVVLVTGGNTGIGYGIIKAILPLQPARICLCARSQAKAEAAIESLDPQPSTKIEFLQLDLNSLSSVRACAEAFNNRSGRLDVLFLNAGISSRAPGLTKDGYEVHFGVNYLGHVLLLQLLLPKLLMPEVESPRVVAVSSISGLMFRPPSGLALDKMRTTVEDWGAIVRYGHSKYALMLAMRGLSRLYPRTLFTSCCPGNVKTNIWDQTDGLNWFIRSVLAPLILSLTGISVEEGAKLPVWCATASRNDRIAGEDTVMSGAFYHPKAGQLKSGLESDKDRELCKELMSWTKKALEMKWKDEN